MDDKKKIFVFLYSIFKQGVIKLNYHNTTQL